MDEQQWPDQELIRRLRALRDEPVAPDVVASHLATIETIAPARGTRPRHLVAAAVAFAILAAGLVTAVTRNDDDPRPTSPTGGSRPSFDPDNQPVSTVHDE